jgi:nucleoside-diphosphate-sugar epimerase
MEGFERFHITGTRHLIDLALSSPGCRSPRFVFLSSISTVANYKGPGGAPEVSIVDESLSTMGYGLSKLVGERITEMAAKKSELDVAIVRIGQISCVVFVILEDYNTHFK